MEPYRRFKILLAAAAITAVLSACGVGTGEDTSPQAIRRALEQGDFGRVQSLVAAAYDAEEISGETRLLAGLNDLAISNGIGAENHFQVAKNMGIAAATIDPLLAEALARQGKIEEARHLVTKANDTAASAIVEGIAARIADQPWQAREAFERAYRLNSKNQRLALDLAEMRTQIGLFDDALRLTAQVIKAQPRNIRAYSLAGEVHMRRRNYAAAETAFAGALKIQPSNGGALTGKARAIYGQKKWAAAEKLLAALPGDLLDREDVQLLRGKIAARQRRHEAARTLFAGAGDSLFGDDEAMFLAAQGFAKRGEHWKAVRLLESAVRARPDLPEYHAGLIRAYRAAGDNAAAADRLAAVPLSLKDAPELSEP